MEKRKGDMYNYILETNKVVRDIIRNRQEILASGVNYFLASGIEQVYMLGSGTSYHASLAAKRFMEKMLKMPVHVSYPLVFKDFETIFK